MRKIAVLLTCFNRKNKTLACLDSLIESYVKSGVKMEVDIFLTDDGCTDGTSEAVMERKYLFPIYIQHGDGSLFWNGGMIYAWKAALHKCSYDGFLWLNDDTEVLTDFWTDLFKADEFSEKHFGKKGIYVGSTMDYRTGNFTYGGFVYTNKWTLKDKFIIPNNKDFQSCECSHGNITYVSKEVVDKMGIFYDGYIHGGGDHDYSYRAFRAGFPVLVMPHYAGCCENDHLGNKATIFENLSLKQRIKALNSPFGFNMHNSLLFQKRCFPYRYPFVFIAGYFKAFFPKFSKSIYLLLRRI